jgi:hypothetical protein
MTYPRILSVGINLNLNSEYLPILAVRPISSSRETEALAIVLFFVPYSVGIPSLLELEFWRTNLTTGLLNRPWIASVSTGIL